MKTNFSFHLQTWRNKVVVRKKEENINWFNLISISWKKPDLSSLSSISSLFTIFLNLREDINVSLGDVNESDPLIFEKTLVIFKTKDDMVKAYWDKISFTFKTRLNQENILFLENYVWISNLETIKVEKFKKENFTTKISLEGLSLGDLKNESCILIPKNNLSCIKWNFKNISNIIFENEVNVINFKSLPLKTKIIVKLFSMKDLAELNKLKEYFPEHSELTISYTYTIK